MTIEQIQRLHEAAPFRPLDLFLADGRVLHVGHPEYLMILPSGRLITVHQDEDVVEFVDLELVVSVRFSEWDGKVGRPSSRGTEQ